MRVNFNVAAAAVMAAALCGCQVPQSGSSTHGGDLNPVRQSARETAGLPQNEARSSAVVPPRPARRPATADETPGTGRETAKNVPGTGSKQRTVVRLSRSKAARTQKVVRKGDPGKLHALVSRYAQAHGVPVSLAHAVVKVESNYRTSARGKAGEVGLMQIKPATARHMGFKGSSKALFNPETNLEYGMKYLAGAYRRGGGTTCGTILKYNAGHGARRMNRISSAYCSKVKRILGSG